MATKKRYRRAVIGLDQSYNGFGIGLAIDGRLKSCTSLTFEGLNDDEKIAKRFIARDRVEKLIIKAKAKCEVVEIYYERIRTRNAGAQSLKYIPMTAMLIGCVIDMAYTHDVPCYSVMTTSWKAKLHVQPNKKQLAIYTKEMRDKPKKAMAVDFIERLGFDCSIYNDDGSKVVFKTGKRKGIRKENDDKADAGCIALYGFVPIKSQCRMLET